MNLKRSSASRGELTKAMSATLREVRLHHQQIAAALAGIQQLMDGQAALGGEFESLKLRMMQLESAFQFEALKEHVDPIKPVSRTFYPDARWDSDVTKSIDKR